MMFVMPYSRRRRLTFYILAFAAMLVTSSFLDVRRASLNHQRIAKVQLAFPAVGGNSAAAYGGAPSDTSWRVPQADPAHPGVSVKPHGSIADEKTGERISPEDRSGSDSADAGSKGGKKDPDSAEILTSSIMEMLGKEPEHKPDVVPSGSTPGGKEGQAGKAENTPTGDPSAGAADAIHAAEAPPGQINAGGSPEEHGSEGGADKHFDSIAQLSPQELRDGVDQLLAHVEEEENVKQAALAGVFKPQGTAAAGIGNTPGADTTGSGANAKKEGDNGTNGVGEAKGNGPAPPSGGLSVEGKNPPLLNSSVMLGQPHADGPKPANSSEPRLSTEEAFNLAQKRLDSLMASDRRRHVDENDLRLVQALGLQATRGNCEEVSASEGRSLFKSDAEAASNVDLERTDPLWGAWCIFMGTYKSEAMRDFSRKLYMLERNANESEAAPTNNSTSFDQKAASLDDVMDTDLQTSVTGKLHYLRPHLEENELRYIGALSLQAAFGDCSPYGKQSTEVRLSLSGGAGADSAPKEDLRVLVEPLTGQIAQRREGALWGAWCVLKGQDRTLAASELVERTDLLLTQLTKRYDAPPYAGNADDKLPASAKVGVAAGSWIR